MVQLIVGIIMICLWAVSIVFWVVNLINVISLFGMELASVTIMNVLQVVGVVVAPLGSLMGPISCFM